MKIVMFSLLLFTGGGLNAQMIQLINERTGTPIPNVVIYDSRQTQSEISDFQGLADISQFKKTDSIFFQHPSFDKYGTVAANVPDILFLIEKVIHTEQVVIAANKWEQDLSEIPQEIVAIEAADIEFRNPATSADLLAQSGEVFVQKSQLGGGSPSLRGFAANAVLLVFDGVRMNNAIYRSGNLQNIISIDPMALEGVEVLMGTGSVIYGSDALGGVIDFHSVTPRFSRTGEVTYQPEFMVRYASAANEKTMHGSLQVAGSRWASYTSISFNDFNDLRTGKSLNSDYPDYGIYSFVSARDENGNDVILESDASLQEPTGYNALSFLQKVKYSPAQDIDLTYSMYINRTGNVPRFDRLFITDENGDPEYAEWYYGPQKWMMHSLKAEFMNPVKFYDKLRIISSYQHYEESRFDRRFGSSSLQAQEEKLTIGGLNIDADKRIGSRSDLFYGFETVANWVSSTAYRENTADGTRQEATPRYPDEGSTYISTAAYTSASHYLNQTLTLTGGLRYTHVWLNASTSDNDAAALESRNISLSNGSLSGNLGVVWTVGHGHRISALISSGFRSPNVDDVGKVFELDGNDLIIPNDDLKPEKTYNAEVSWSYSNKGLQLEATAFYTYLSNAIVRGRAEINSMDSIFYNGAYYHLFSQVNAAKADIYGAAFSASYSFTNHFAIRGTFNYNDGAERDTGEPLRHTTPLFGSLSATWLINAFKLEGYIDFNGNRFRKNIPSSEIESKPYLYAMHISDPSKDGSPGWYTINFRGSWQASPAFLLQASFENLFDMQYRPYSNGISAPGRNIILSLRFSPGI